MSRQNKGKILPPFKKVDINIQDYDTIFFGHSVWDMRLPPAFVPELSLVATIDNKIIGHMEYKSTL
ncbi:hypothetical protein FXV77_20740 [Sphingobacterium phlebotomi]|uniref:Uncharacterized protein n=1 Tax=Sphingobacterium phlebotomi TaxID=2605433 RepID=A0A5D4GUU1_9SPHI|nr:hypothetical protein [Sphingobacterium phlebotomi]TYR31673.1 hypothetical protein FXV77_20740 [Sphingobacterium phlebotomi]